MVKVNMTTQLFFLEATKSQATLLLRRSKKLLTAFALNFWNIFMINIQA